MDIMYVFIVNAFVCAYAVLLFIWWWKYTGRATQVYKFVTLLFVSGLLENAMFAYSRYIEYYGGDHGVDAHFAFTHHRFWWVVATPTFIAFSLITIAMTFRILKTKIALKKITEHSKPSQRMVSKNVLVVSAVKETRNFMKGLFINNSIDYYQTNNLIEAFDCLVHGKSFSVVMIGLSIIEESGLSARIVIDIIRRENPWCMIVAITRQPSAYELFEVRRAYFDDYIYLPIRPGVLIATYLRWLSKVRRWRSIKGVERRMRDGIIFDRKNIKEREGDCYENY